MILVVQIKQEKLNSLANKNPSASAFVCHKRQRGKRSCWILDDIRDDVPIHSTAKNKDVVTVPRAQNGPLRVDSSGNLKM